MTPRPNPKPPVGAAIAGTGLALPDRVLTNADLEAIVETSDDWITKRTGIKTRRVAEPGTRTSDLAADAVGMALANAGLDPRELDLLLLATMTEDVVCPATACEVVKKINAIPCGAMDINIACTGFVAGLNVASGLMATGQYQHVAVVAADVLSRIVDWDDRGTCVLFGDAAAAAIISATDDVDRGSIYQTMGSDAQRGQVLYVPRTERDIPDSEAEHFSGKLNTLQMNGKAVYKFAVEKLAECVEEALDATGLGPDDIKMVIPHQSNIRMLKSAWKRLGFDEAKIHINIDRYGNTSAASAGVCLHELMDADQLEPGDRVVFVAQGGGLSWGANLWRI